MRDSESRCCGTTEFTSEYENGPRGLFGMSSRLGDSGGYDAWEHPEAKPNANLESGFDSIPALGNSPMCLVELQDGEEIWAVAVDDQVFGWRDIERHLGEDLRVSEVRTDCCQHT